MSNELRVMGYFRKYGFVVAEYYGGIKVGGVGRIAAAMGENAQRLAREQAPR